MIFPTGNANINHQRPFICIFEYPRVMGLLSYDAVIFTLGVM